MRYLMFKKSNLSIVIVLISLTSLPAALSSICDEALKRCVNRCDDIFSSPYNQACRSDCGIGYINCLH